MSSVPGIIPPRGLYIRCQGIVQKPLDAMSRALLDTSASGGVFRLYCLRPGAFHDPRRKTAGRRFVRVTVEIWRAFASHQLAGAAPSRTTSTGQCACRTTRSATLPRSRCFSPLRPCVGMTMRST